MKTNSLVQSLSAANRRNGRVHILEIIGNSGMGGMETYLQNFIAKLPQDQFRVTCICPFESQFTAELRRAGVENIFIAPIADDPIWRTIQLTVEVSKLHKVDVLHAHMPKAHVLAGLAGCMIHKPVVATIHGMNVTSHELGIHRAVASRLITNCQESYMQALAMGVEAENVTLIKNGVDTNIFNCDENNGDALRNAINVPKGTPLVGFVGRLDQEKGPDLFLRAAEHVHRLHPEAHFVMIGDGRMRELMHVMRDNMNLNDHLHFVGWWKNTAEVYPALDLLVHTSRSDGTSLVVLEAMSCGCPVVGISVGGIPEIIENENTGLLAGLGDWEGVGMHIVYLLEHLERLKTMGVAARQRVKQHFDLSNSTRATADLLRSIALEGKAAQPFDNATLVAELGGKMSLDSTNS